MPRPARKPRPCTRCGENHLGRTRWCLRCLDAVTQNEAERRGRQTCNQPIYGSAERVKAYRATVARGGRLFEG